MDDSTGFRKCDESSCEFPATHWLVWTKPQVYCVIHANAMINLGNIMGFPTPASTVRPLTFAEMMVDDDGEDTTT